jgi:hypothetical protein
VRRQDDLRVEGRRAAERLEIGVHVPVRRADQNRREAADQIAGYELQVYLGHAMLPDNNGTKRDGDVSFWYPATRLHGLGTWSVPLRKGFHELKIVYIDFRMDGPKRLNRVEGVRDCVWSGERPALMISGPGVKRQPIPAAWLWR